MSLAAGFIVLSHLLHLLCFLYVDGNVITQLSVPVVMPCLPHHHYGPQPSGIMI